MPPFQYQTPAVYINELGNQQSLKNNLYHDVESTLSLVADELNKYLKTLFSTTEDRVVLSSLNKLDGSFVPNIDNKVVMQLINLGYVKDTLEEGNDKDKTYTVIFSANFNQYLEALKQIGAVADFFQFACPQGKAKYIPNANFLKIYSLDYDIKQINEVFGLLKSSYIPSLAYQIIVPSFDIKTFVHSNSENLKQEIEDNIQSILQQFVFSANTFPNWLAIRYLVDEYLYSLCNDSLFGDTLEKEYTVNIGLGETMTAQDILDGFVLLSTMLKFKDEDDFVLLTFKVQLAL